MSTEHRLNPNFIGNYLVLKPGNFALFREASSIIPEFSQRATLVDYMVNNLATFPWGFNPEQPPNWDYIGINGLRHQRWFVCDDGYRIGGAKNVRKLDGYYRFNQLTHQGMSDGFLSENEGYAIKIATDELTQLLFRITTRFIGAHTGVDGGNVIISPICDNNIVYFELTGRCKTCPNKVDSGDNFISFIKEQFDREERDFNLQFKKYKPVYLEQLVQA